MRSVVSSYLISVIFLINDYKLLSMWDMLEMFYLNIPSICWLLFLFVEQLDQFEVCLPYSRLLTGIPMLAALQNLRWNSIKTSLIYNLGIILYAQ